MKKRIDFRFMSLVIVTVLIGFWRILTASEDPSPWSTFSPVGALALFGGAYFSRRYASYLFPLLILLISDLVLMNTTYSSLRTGWLYDSWYWTYGSFALMVTLGEYLRNRVSVKNVLLGCIAAGLVHFTVSNFGVWLGGCTNPATGLLYPPTFSGLISCYLAALPYFQSLLLGNLVFSLVLFGGFEWVQSRIEALKPTSSSS